MNNSQLSKSGLTLLELLIAISIFAFLCLILAGLIKVSFDLWRGSERQGDITDRRQVVLKYIKHDLESRYVETENREIIKNIIEGGKLPSCVTTKEPCFYTDVDSLGNHWLYLIRTDEDTLYEFISDNIPSKKLTRVIYYVKTEANGNSALYRVILDESTAIEFFEDKKYETGDFPQSSSAMIFTDVIYFGVRVKNIEQEDFETKWNSLPETAEELEASSPENILITEQVLPDISEIEISLKPAVFPESNIDLKTDAGSILNVSNTKGLPAPPDYVKINNEWCYYNKLTSNKIMVEKRGARNTENISHMPNTILMYGETLKETVYLNTK